MNAVGRRAGLMVAVILAYALLEHYSNARPERGALGACLAVAPLVLALWLAAGRAPRPLLTTAVAAACASAVLVRYWGDIERDFPLMYLLQQLGADLLLAGAFGRSLLPGQVALCTHWADLVHGPLPPAVQRYTRQVTMLWTAFFLVTGAVDLALYLLAPLRVWSVYANFLVLPLAVLVFLLEYTLRQWVVPPLHRVSLARTVRAYLDATSHRPAPRG